MTKVKSTNKESTMNHVSLIPAVLANMSEKKSVLGDIAKYCFKFEGSSVNQIGLAFFQCQMDREKARQETLELGTTSIEPAFKPERFLSFVQSVMNSVCWAGRKYNLAIDRGATIYGVEGTTQVADELNVPENMSVQELIDVIDQDFLRLNVLQSAIAGRMNYLNDIEPLFYFEQRTQNTDGEWVVAKQCVSFDEAQDEMTEIVARLQEESIAKDRNDFLSQLASVA